MAPKPGQFSQPCRTVGGGYASASRPLSGRCKQTFKFGIITCGANRRILSVVKNISPTGALIEVDNASTAACAVLTGKPSSTSRWSAAGSAATANLKAMSPDASLMRLSPPTPSEPR